MIRPNNAAVPEIQPEKTSIEEWFYCPRCRTKIFGLKPGARCSGIRIKCRRCKKIINVSL